MANIIAHDNAIFVDQDDKTLDVTLKDMRNQIEGVTLYTLYDTIKLIDKYGMVNPTAVGDLRGSGIDKVRIVFDENHTWNTYLGFDIKDENNKLTLNNFQYLKYVSNKLNKAEFTEEKFSAYNNTIIELPEEGVEEGVYELPYSTVAYDNDFDVEFLKGGIVKYSGEYHSIPYEIYCEILGMEEDNILKVTEIKDIDEVTMTAVVVFDNEEEVTIRYKSHMA